jgi:hypothetical protein
MAYIADLGGMTGGAFASADFGDAEELTGVAFDIGGHGQSAPYSIAVNSIVDKQIHEIRSKVKDAANLASTWRLRFREFISKKNNEMLDFLKLSVPSHPVLGPGEILLRRFGNPQVSPFHPSVKDMVIDISGETGIEDLSSFLTGISGENAVDIFTKQTYGLYDLYKEAAMDALKAQSALKIKLDKLDKVQSKISGLFEIQSNEAYEPFLKAGEAYLKNVYEESKFEEDYMNVVKAYRKFVSLREVVISARTVLAQESEPLCSICLEETVSYAISPCGHTFCQGCSRKQNGSCFVCRTGIHSKLKLYFG